MAGIRALWCCIMLTLLPQVLPQKVNKAHDELAKLVEKSGGKVCCMVCCMVLLPVCCNILYVIIHALHRLGFVLASHVASFQLVHVDALQHKTTRYLWVSWGVA